MKKYREQLPTVKAKYRDELIESEARPRPVEERAHGLREERAGRGSPPALTRLPRRLQYMRRGRGDLHPLCQQAGHRYDE
ncbi:hypothetical protein QJS66_02700 [Kocuria rhizophila]|nr:hypothetical protein QJS66_02700 [Kocuria rhizophila]